MLAPCGALESSGFQTRIGHIFVKGCHDAIHWQRLHSASYHKRFAAGHIAIGKAIHIGRTKCAKAIVSLGFL